MRTRAPLFCLLLCTFSILLIATTKFNISRGAAPDQLPLPIDIPVPPGVLHTDSFADALAIDGDILAVGAPDTTVNGNTQQGVVYLYTRAANDPTAFTLLKSITGSDSGPRDSFGYSVDIHGDTLVVGNATSTNNAAYVFARNQGGANQWGEVKKLARDDNRTFTDFGRTLAIHGDTVLVGAPLGLGEVFVYQRDAGGANAWGKTQMLDTGLPVTTSIKVAGFGETIAFDGTHLVISAPRLGLTVADVPDDAPPIPENYFGAVFVYRHENGQWLPDAKLFSPDVDLDEDPLWDDRFGATLAINGDTLFIGAPDGRIGNVAPGKVFVFQKGSGSALPYGEAGDWGEVIHLAASDGAQGDAFGTSLYAVDDGLFVGAPRLGVGTVYFFRDPAGASSSIAPLTVQNWGEVYGFSASNDGSSTEFGNPIAGSGGTVLFGDGAANDGIGGVYAYAKDALFAHNPNATPTPSETPPTVIPPTVTPPPDEAEPCLPIPQSEQPRLFLPHVIGSESPANVATQATPQAPTAIFTATLAPGCVATSPDGVKVAAVAGAITQTVAFMLAATTAPPEALPDGVSPVGGYWHLAAGETVHVQMETPFVIGMPVPDSADPAHLVITHLHPATRTLDSGAGGNVWGYLPGVYDATSKLFLARLPFLLAEGTTLALVQHPDFATPLNQPASGVQAAAIGAFDGFRVHCIRNTFNNASHCTEVMEATVEGVLDDIYLRMTDSQFFGFPTKLRLLEGDEQFIVTNVISLTDANFTYAAYLVGPKDPECDTADGYYNPDSGYLALCIHSGTNIDARHKAVLIHEFFHAVQFTYRKVLGDFSFWQRHQPWIIEGTAAASMDSYPVTIMQRTGHYSENSLQNVDEALTIGVAGDGLLDEYLAQDFWVYVGLSEEASLGYLGPVLSRGGAFVNNMDTALKLHFGKSLGEFYWG